MQVWIHYILGAGGDGFANLLEQANEVVTAEFPNKIWRFHRICHGRLKFYGTTITDNVMMFRQPGNEFREGENQLLEWYSRAVQEKKTIIFPCHDVLHDDLSKCAHQDILTEDRVNVLLTNRNVRKCVEDAHIKNRRPMLDEISILALCNEMEALQDKAVRSGIYDLVIDINEARTSYMVFNDFCSKIGLTITKDCYDFYCNASTSTKADDFLQSLGLLERIDFEEGPCYNIHAIETNRVTLSYSQGFERKTASPALS